MSWKELTRAVAARAEVSEAESRRILTAFVDEVEARLQTEEAVRIPGIGTLRCAWEAERQVRGVRDGRKIALDGHWRPAFTPSETLKRALRARTPQLLKDPEHQRAWRLAETLVGDLSLYHPDLLPRDLSPEAEPAIVDLRCGASLGPAWTRARESFEARTPPHVRDVRDYLALSARRRWAQAA